MFFEDTRQFHAGEPLICVRISPSRKLTVAKHMLEGLDVHDQPADHSLRLLAAEFLDQVAGIVLGIKQYREQLRRLANLFQSLEQFSGACATTVCGYYIRAFLAIVDGASKGRPVKTGRYKILTNRFNNFGEAALVQRHIHRQPPPTAERSARGKPDGGGWCPATGCRPGPAPNATISN